MKKETIIHNVKDFAVITFGAALATATIFFFMLPSNVAVGSASALAMVLSNFIPLPVSALNLVINVILLIIGFILIGSEFGAKTVYTSIMVPAFCYDTKIVVLSVIGTYFGGMVVDHFIFGLNIKRRVCAISPKLDGIVGFILHDLHSGATLNEIVGAYESTPEKRLLRSWISTSTES